MNGTDRESGLRDLLQIAGGAIAYFIVFFFIFPNHPAIGGALSVCVIGEVMAARACWNRRHHPWFWLTLAGITFIQAAIIVTVPWPETRFPGMVLVPIGLADYAIVYGIVRFVERLMS